ncbi:MAG: hypothetical protein ACRD0K_24095 [Egibacteraceae bacterium]
MTCTVARAYKGQPRLERRHATLKGVIDAAPIWAATSTTARLAPT